MADKELCFYVGGNELYLEQVLVDYNDIPIFFVCKDNMKYYIVLCSDIEELSYIVANLSDVDLYYLLHGMLSMRDVITKQKSYWEIVSGETIELDMVVCKSMQEIDYSVLPEEGAYFEGLTDGVLAYIRKFDEEFMLKENFKELLPALNFDENNENFEPYFELMRKFIELYAGQLKQKIVRGFDNNDIDYEIDMYDTLESNITISGNEHSEKWNSVEIEILSYAA